jgi:alpha-L-rhamnosidase
MRSEFFVSHLRCEYLVDPLGIDVLEPRLSWLIQSTRRGARQTAYQIHAEDKETGVQVWDSGKVVSDQTTHIVYAGSTLKSRQRVGWKVRVWDEFGNPTEWSETAWWEMGLLNASDWTADWIEAPLVGGPRTSSPCPYMRKGFNLSKKGEAYADGETKDAPGADDSRSGRKSDRALKKARLYITALGLYEAHLNGKIIGDDVLNPGWTDYHQRVRYRVYDVTSLLLPEENVLGVILGDGWYCGNIAWQGRQNYGDRPKLLAQLQVEYSDGSQICIKTDRTWKTSFGPLIESDLLMGESYDARLEFGGWSQPGFDDERWQRVQVFPDPGVKRVGINGPMVKRIQELHPVAEPVEIQGWPISKWIYDFGQNMVGHVRMKVSGPIGTTITLRFGEVLNPEGSLYTANLRTARQTDYFTLKGDGEETFEPHFTFHGFRYVEVSGLAGKPERDLLTGVVMHSALPVTGSFECSDPLLNQLQHNILWGQKGNFVDVPTDCPQRDERLGWTGDAQAFIRTATFNMDVGGFYTKWQQDLADAQNELGVIPPFAPNAKGGISDGGPAWADAVVICPWTIYLTYGDKRLLETNYESLERFAGFIIKSSRNFIRASFELPPSEADEWLWEGFGDWLAQDGSGKVYGGTPKDLIGTAFFAYSIRLLGQIASALNKDGDARKYEELYRTVREAFIRRFITEDGLIIGQTQTAYVLALHFDLLPEKMRPNAVQALIKDIQSRRMHLSTGFVGTPYLMHVLTREGHLDVAYEILLQKTWPSWLYPVTQGATTIWERWDGWTHDKGFQDPGMNSFNHYAYGAIGDWLYTVVAGIEADIEQPGFKHILLQPRPGGGLTHVRAAYDSINGRIESSWKIEDNRMEWEVSVPPNTTATVHIPTKTSSKVLEGTRPLDLASGISRIRQDTHALECELESGRYQFMIEPYTTMS